MVSRVGMIGVLIAFVLASLSIAQDSGQTSSLTVTTNQTVGTPSLIMPMEPNTILTAPPPADEIDPNLTPAPAPLPNARPRQTSRSERALWPVSGVITQYYTRARYRRGHTGLDIAAPSGTPIYASVSGTVTGSGWNRFGYGMLITIRGVDGRDYYYAHNSRLLVRRGQWVEQGQMISKMGSTGRSTGPHLHFEVRSGGRLLNPLAQLPSSRLALASYRGKKR